MSDEQNFGPPAGIKIKSLVVEGEATIAGTPVSSGTISDDLVVTGSHTVTTGTGDVALNGDTELAADKDFTGAAGSGKVDLKLMTGTLDTPTGTNTIRGNLVIDKGKSVSIDASGGAGAGNVDFSNSTGTTKTTTGAVTIGPGAVEITGDATITAGKKLTKGVTINRMLAKTADYAVADTDPDIVVVGAITALATATITLPTLADNQGRTITVIVAGDPGANDVVIEGEGAETINGAANKTNSTQYSSISMLATAAEWIITGHEGTWT